MSLSYNDLTLLRYIQKRQMIPLSKTALHFQKNESSIRRTIEQINLYSSEPMVRIEKSICYSCISYEDLVSFIRNLDQKDYLSSSDERIRVMITAIFFQNYVNSSKLYEQWGLSLTTKKQDTALLRQFLTRYGLELVTKKKKGLSIQGDELQDRKSTILCLNLHQKIRYLPVLQIRLWRSRPMRWQRNISPAVFRKQPKFFPVFSQKQAGP